MTFEGARAELKEISGGRFRVMRYELTENEDGVVSVNCNCYIDPKVSTQGKTWREALDAIRVLLSPAPPAPTKADEAPIDDNANKPG